MTGSSIATALLLSLLIAAASAPAADPPRTAWGAPDLQGVWDFRTITPLERPDELAGKEVLAAGEAAQFQAKTLERRNTDRRHGDAARDVRGAYNDFWLDYGDSLTEDKRTSLLVDPPDGKIPELTPGGKARAAARREALDRPPHGPEDRGSFERCILGFNAGTPMNPSGYNNNVQIFQTPDHVALLIEMVHDVRVVPLDARPPLPGRMRQWKGDSRGHWEGDALVVETRNYRNETSFRGAGPNMRLVERFTRLSPERLLYEYTITDPESFTKPWSVAVPMKKNDQPIYEYACHEGNYAMETMLAGARAQEKAAAASRTAEPRP